MAPCDFLSRLLGKVKKKEKEKRKDRKKKNILHQHLLLGADKSDTSVAWQPLWLLFSRTGPLTRCVLGFFFSSFFFPFLVPSQGCITLFWCLSQRLKMCRNQRKTCLLLVHSQGSVVQWRVSTAGSACFFMLCNDVFVVLGGVMGYRGGQTATVIKKYHFSIFTKILVQKGLILGKTSKRSRLS